MKLEKITNVSRRRYPDACGTAHALDLIGDRWALLIMRELMLGPCRFGELRAALPGLSANVLTQRLEELEQAGVVVRRKLPPPASVQVYVLTEWGLEAEPIVRELGRWGARSPLHDPTLPLSPVSMMLSFKTMFDPAKAGGARLTVRFRFGADTYWMRIDGRTIDGGRGEGGEPDVELAGPPGAIAGLVYGFADQDELERQGTLTVTGDRTALARFTAMFDLPPKAA